MSDNLPERTEFLLYQTDDDRILIETRMQDETVWLTQKQMAELFQKDIRTINEHLKNIYVEGELVSESTIRKFRIVRLEGRREVARSDISRSHAPAWEPGKNQHLKSVNRQMKDARFIGTMLWLIMIRLRAQAERVERLLDWYLITSFHCGNRKGMVLLTTKEITDD